MYSRPVLEVLPGKYPQVQYALPLEGFSGGKNKGGVNMSLIEDDVARARQVAALADALAKALTQLRDLDAGYPERELFEPLRVTFTRGKNALRSVGFPVEEIQDMV